MDVCAERGLFLSNTFFQHKMIHRYTWRRREDGGENKICKKKRERKKKKDNGVEVEERRKRECSVRVKDKRGHTHTHTDNGEKKQGHDGTRLKTVTVCCFINFVLLNAFCLQGVCCECLPLVCLSGLLPDTFSALPLPLSLTVSLG